MGEYKASLQMSSGLGNACMLAMACGGTWSCSLMLACAKRTPCVIKKGMGDRGRIMAMPAPPCTPPNWCPHNTAWGDIGDVVKGDGAVKARTICNTTSQTGRAQRQGVVGGWWPSGVVYEMIGTLTLMGELCGWRRGKPQKHRARPAC
jgi:hypothetical protein